MSKLLSKEQVGLIARLKWEKEFDEDQEPYQAQFYYQDGFKDAFTLLMPIIERQETALMEINDLLLDGKSMYVADRVTIAHKALKETKQMLEQLGEKK